MTPEYPEQPEAPYVLPPNLVPPVPLESLPPAAPPVEAPIEYGPPMPPDYKQTSIVMLIVMFMSLPVTCCCVFYGLPSFAGMGCAMGALIQSSSVSQLYMKSDFEGAEKVSAQVKKWLIASILAPFVVTGLLIVVSVVFMGGIFALGSLTEYLQKNF